MTYTEPLLPCILLVLAIGARQPRWRHAAILALFAISWGPVDWLISRPLEMGYPPVATPAVEADAIVVLGSYVEPPDPVFPMANPDNNTAMRCRWAAWLYRHWHQKPVLACAGPSPGGVAARTMRSLLEEGGVPPEMIWTEERSGSTHENAVFGGEVLRRRGARTIVLVTEPVHMYRAARCFEKQGFRVFPSPSETRDFGWRDLNFVLPNWRAMQGMERTLHELVGIAWYAATGRI